MEHFLNRCKGGMHTDVRAVKLDDSSVLEFLILAEQLEAWKAEDDVAAAEERRRARRAHGLE